jgi:hypothetical protein
MLYLIPHAPWAPGRAKALARLKEQLPQAVVVPSRGPEHAAIWARRVWEMAAYAKDHVCILNDDVLLAPDFEGRIARAVAAQPTEPISLHCSNPNVLPIKGAWARCYHYSGPGVILPPGAAADLCEYLYSLPWPMIARMNEDNIACAWAWDRQRPFWYLLPSPLTHDTKVPSTLGYDNHPWRTPCVLGDERDVTDLSAPFVELDWCTTKGLNYRRMVLQAGRQLCLVCVGREGVVGDGKVMVCRECVTELAAVMMRAQGGGK